MSFLSDDQEAPGNPFFNTIPVLVKEKEANQNQSLCTDIIYIRIEGMFILSITFKSHHPSAAIDLGYKNDLHRKMFIKNK